ncbi:MAG: RNA-binding S4 domain-containing protein [Synechococcales cyanobacterium RM1_1_8]|nr:RNA-binding S4 domain-containing protein [Synechococcales cyanobacterium RM1_1_8]
MSNEKKPIKLDQFLKFQNLAETGGEAKLLIQDCQVEVNGVVETRRGRKLAVGDRVTLNGQTWTVE